MPTKAFKQRADYAAKGKFPSQIGILEACYNNDLALDLLKALDGKYMEENFLFLIAVNHILLRKCNITSTLPKAIEQAAKLPSADKAQYAIFSSANDKQSLLSQMQHVMDVFVVPGGACEVNVKYNTRMALTGKRSAIESAQAAQAFVNARQEIMFLAQRNITQIMSSVSFPKKLDDVIYTAWSPTDEAVQKLLGKLGVTSFDFNSD